MAAVCPTDANMKLLNEKGGSFNKTDYIFKDENKATP